MKLGQIFAKVIQARRSSPHKEEDVLQQFCDARYQNVLGGRQLTEEEITGLLIAVLFAGQHTSSITSSWTGYYMIDAKVGVLGCVLFGWKGTSGWLAPGGPGGTRRGDGWLLGGKGWHQQGRVAPGPLVHASPTPPLMAPP